jgi:hypothetical protein
VRACEDLLQVGQHERHALCGALDLELLFIFIIFIICYFARHWQAHLVQNPQPATIYLFIILLRETGRHTLCGRTAHMDKSRTVNIDNRGSTYLPVSSRSRRRDRGVAAPAPSSLGPLRPPVLILVLGRVPCAHVWGKGAEGAGVGDDDGGGLLSLLLIVSTKKQYFKASPQKAINEHEND